MCRARCVISVELFFDGAKQKFIYFLYRCARCRSSRRECEAQQLLLRNCAERLISKQTLSAEESGTREQETGHDWKRVNSSPTRRLTGATFDAPDPFEDSLLNYDLRNKKMRSIPAIRNTAMSYRLWIPEAARQRCGSGRSARPFNRLHRIVR